MGHTVNQIFLPSLGMIGDADSLRDRRDSEVGVGDLDGLVDEIAEPTEYEGPSIEKFAGKYPAVWYGAFMLKNTAFPTQMHLINGLYMTSCTVWGRSNVM